jgi:hypothetical protein
LHHVRVEQQIREKEWEELAVRMLGEYEPVVKVNITPPPLEATDQEKLALHRTRQQARRNRKQK